MRLEEICHKLLRGGGGKKETKGNSDCLGIEIERHRGGAKGENNVKIIGIYNNPKNKIKK